MEQSGQEDLSAGYLGGLLDAATGLIYIGNGQYYDPSTGRFLTRDANPNQTNPYVPWKSDPAGSMLAPLAILAMVYGRKKKRGKWDNLVVVVVLCMAAGIGLSACNRPKTTTVETSTATAVVPTTLTQNGTVEASATIAPKLATATDAPTLLPYGECEFSLIPAPSGSPYVNGVYDWRGAVQFARDNHTKDLLRSHGYKVYEGDQNSDCTNFVSFALSEGGKLREIDQWNRNNATAWYRTSELFTFVQCVGFHPFVMFTSSGNYIYTENIDKEKDKYLPLRENSLSFEQKQVIGADNYWSKFLNDISNAKAGDLVFYEDWHEAGWSHMGIITEDWQSPTHYSYTTLLDPDPNEPQMIDHDGVVDNTPRSIGDTGSMRVHKVVILYNP